MANETMIKKVNDVMNAPSCCAELKAACKAWIDAIGTPNQKKAADALVAELKEDVTPIDGLLAFLGTPIAAEKIGAEAAAGMKAAATKAKAEGAKVCICPACTAGAKVLEDTAKLYE